MAPSLVLIVFFFAAFAWCSVGAASTVPAIFVFGDSLADVGNNNYLNTSTAKADFPHNGIDFPGSTPTGRFSNGYNIIDWLAKFVGYKRSPPAFLTLTDVAQMLRGVNFASGGAGILDNTGTNIITFRAQIMNFKTVIDDLCEQIGQESVNQLLSKSLFLISAGSNDMLEYYSTFGPRITTGSQQFVASLIDKFSDHLKALYRYEARKFGIIGISHVGCVPAIASQNPTGKCVEDLNGLARSFNTGARARMHHLQSKLQGMKYSYGNVYDLMSLALANPSLNGYEDIKNACCWHGEFSGGYPCTPTAALCSNRSQYLFWDRFHPTQVASMYTAMQLYSGPRRFAAPVNLKVLVMD